MHSVLAQLLSFSFFLYQYFPSAVLQLSSVPELWLVFHEAAFLVLAEVASHKVQEAGHGKGAHRWQIFLVFDPYPVQMQANAVW